MINQIKDLMIDPKAEPWEYKDDNLNGLSEKRTLF